jgi:hypothetical protein
MIGSRLMPLVGILTFLLGSGAAWVFLSPKVPSNVQCLTVTPQPEDRPKITKVDKDDLPQEPSLDDIDVQNPYEIAAKLNGMSLPVIDLWKRLGISDSFNGIWRHERTETFFTSCNGCAAETNDFDLDGDGVNEVILRVANLMEESRYLVFKERSWNHYKLIGHFDHDFGRYEMPEHHFVLSHGNAYLVIRVQTASGSGVATYDACILAMRKNRLIPILSFPSDGQLALLATTPSREYRNRVSDISEDGATTRVELALTVNYEVDGPNITTARKWRNHARAVYFKTAGSREAYFSPSSSSISKKQFEAEYSDDSLDEDFIKFNRPQLKAVGWKRPQND